MHKLKIDISIYGCNVRVIIDENIEKVVASFMRRRTLPDGALENDGSTYHGLAIKGAKFQDYYVFFSKESLNINIISHEISHIVDFILTDREIENNGETRAYLTGYITEKIVDYVISKGLFINKHINNNKEILNQVDETQS